MKPTKTYSIEEAADAFRAGKRIEGTTRIGNPFALVDFAIGGKRKFRFRNPKGPMDSRNTNPSFDTPEDALRWVARTLPHITLTVFDPLPLGTIGTVSPPPAPLVPLGENVTRDGHKARVLCIDRAGHGNNDPVVGLISINENEEILRHFRADGSISGNREDALSQWDLVGHLPPEPAKPREFWINCYELEEDTVYESKEHADKSAAPYRSECIHVCEVLPGEADELEQLRDWKRQAIEAMPDWQAIGKEMGLTIGPDVPSKILPYILSLKKFIGSLRQPHVSASTEAAAALLLEP